MNSHASFFVIILVCLLASSWHFTDASYETGSAMFLSVGYGASSVRRIIYVPDDFEKIQEAINNSTDGDIVLVRPGTYTGSIVINRRIFLIGANKSTTILDGERKSDVVTIEKDNVVLTGFTIRNGNFPARYGVHINNRVNVTVQNNIIINNFDGINLYYANSNTIRWNNLLNNHYGIFLAHSSGNVVYANNVSASEWNGIELDWSDQNVIEANTVSFSQAYGLEIPGYHTPARNNLFFHNNFFNNTLGVRVYGYINLWSKGYPAGGNFWGFSVGVDEFSGPAQNQPGSDGIIDTPYRIDANNIDQYPLVNPFNPSPPNIPKADFSFMPEKPFVGNTVTFSSLFAHSDGNAFSYFWNFGDGTRAQGANTTHVYVSPSFYPVDLYVIDNTQGFLAIESKLIKIEEPQFSNVATYMTIGIITSAIVAIVAYFTRINKRRDKLDSHKEPNLKKITHSTLHHSKKGINIY